ncbi:MAG: molybdenum cofactor guanylyltransferase [Opitutaceae bacterium]|nr:molybdenum cofactor guanylyltransferase [Opitutaceae bacterium]
MYSPAPSATAPPIAAAAPPAAPLTGALLLGGRSRRMGRDKALLPAAGEPLWRRQARVLHEAGAERVSVVLRRRQLPPPGLADASARVLRDRFPGAGPLAGLHAALSAEPPGALVMLLAVDLPRIDAAWFVWLLRFCQPGAGAAACAAGVPEPLAAIYPAEAAPLAAAALAAGDCSLRRLLPLLAGRGLLRLAEIPPGHREIFANCNTPADYAALFPETSPTT